MQVCSRKEAWASHDTNTDHPRRRHRISSINADHCSLITPQVTFRKYSPWHPQGVFLFISGGFEEDLIFYLPRHPDLEPCPRAGLRLDQQPPADRLRPFRSAGEPVVAFADQIEPAAG